MDKQEAAKFLGISVRTLERFAAQGKLRKGRAMRNNRPVAFFDRAQLDSLKEELETARPSEVFRPQSVQKPKDAIGFRLDPFYVSRLVSAGEVHGLSAAEYARKLVIQGLEDTRVELFKDEIAKLRYGLAEVFYELLVRKLEMSEEDAESLVRETIWRDNSPRQL